MKAQSVFAGLIVTLLIFNGAFGLLNLERCDSEYDCDGELDKNGDSKYKETINPKSDSLDRDIMHNHCSNLSLKEKDFNSNHSGGLDFHVQDTNQNLFSTKTGNDIDGFKFSPHLEDNQMGLREKITADDYQTHEPIRIDNNVDFAKTAEQEGWEGNGSEEAPWIIEDYKIDGRESGFCIYIGNVTDHFSIRYCHLSNATGHDESGIYLYDSKNGNLSNNTMVDNFIGMIIRDSTNIRVYNNSLSATNETEGLGEGILFKRESYNNTIVDNKITGNFHGVKIESSPFAPAAYYPHDNRIAGNQLKQNYKGLTIHQYSDGNTISNNTFLRNKDTGIYFREGPEDNLIVDNELIDNPLGISLLASGGNRLIGNSILGSEEGLELRHTVNTTLKNNTFPDCSINIEGGFYKSHWDSHTITSSNTVYGKPIYYLKDQNGGDVPPNAGEVILADCSNITVENQNISGKDNGILMGYSQNNTIADNVISNNSQVGIKGYHCRDNVFTGNDVMKNHLGIHLSSSRDNRIYHNNFIDNDEQVRAGGNNHWNATYPSGGNYWSDHVDMDKRSGPKQNKEGSDGFADTPYLISQTSDMDHLPLLEPYREGEPPQITDNTPDSAVAGRNFTFDVKVTDNIEVRDVRIIHWTDPEKKYNRTMDTVRNSNYELKIKVPKDEEDIHYKILALDVSYNEASLGPFSTAIRDINPPRISINRTGNPTTGDFYTLNATVSDNEGIEHVYVDYWTDVTDHVNKSLKNVGEGHYRVNINVPYNATRLKYTVSARDTSGYWTVSESIEIDVIDNDAPTFSADELSPPGTGELYNLNVGIEDNIDIERAYVIYWTDVSGRLNRSLKPMDEKTYETDISIPFRARELYYKISAVDTSSNWAKSEKSSKEIVDVQAPIARAGTDIIVEKGEEVLLNGTSSSDNIGITQYIWYVDGEKIEGNKSTYRFTSGGDHTVKLVVKDEAGNTGSSSFEVYVEDDDKDKGTHPSASSVWVYALTAILSLGAIILILGTVNPKKDKDKKKKRKESKKRAKEELKKLKKKETDIHDK